MKKNDGKLRFEIDHSAKFYPIMATKKAQSIFCLCAKLDHVVDKTALQTAVNDVMPRFVSYKVRLKRGYAWHYLEQNDSQVKVFDMQDRILCPIDTKLTNGYLFRLSVKDSDVRLEIMHVLTDGNGALAFFKTVLARYMQLIGRPLDDNFAMDWQTQPTDEESEDSFVTNYHPVKMKEMKLKELAGNAPHHIDGTLRKDGYTRTVFTADTSQILANAKSIGATFTAYITGVLAYSIDQISKSDKPMVLMVPVNLRKIYNSTTLRNFVTFVRIIIKPNECKSLEEYVEQAKLQIKDKSSKNKMDAFVSTSVKAQGLAILKIVPLWLKAFFMKLGRLFMRSRQTIIYSNLGVVNTTQNSGIERFDFVMNVSKNNTQNLGTITLNDKTCFSFTRAIEETSLPDAFKKTLCDGGIDVVDLDV